MKKILILAVAFVSFCGIAQAQYKPTKGTFTTEVSFSPLNVNTNRTFSIPEMGVKGRYFISDMLAVRANLNFGFNSSTDHLFSGNPEVEQTISISSFSFAVLPGIEYHFGNWEKTSLYAGAEVGFGVMTRSEHTENLAFGSDTRDVNGPSNTSIRFNVFTGFDHYFTENLFVGVELNLGIQSSWTGEREVSQTGQPTTTDKNYTSTTNFGFNCNPAIRLGWKF